MLECNQIGGTNMAKENFYLELLNQHVHELSHVIEGKDNFEPSAYNCILAGIVVRVNAILEQCMLDFHSKNFNEIAKIIYNSRQLLVHYSDYRTFDNLEEISKDIINEFYRVYNSEKEFFKGILTYKNSPEHNVVIPNSKNVIYDEFTNSYIFRNDSVEIVVGSDKITRIQELKKQKDIAYIVNCDCDMNYFIKDENGEVIYDELKGAEKLQAFFKKEFNVIHEDYRKHKQCIKDILDNFYKENSYSSIYVQEKVPYNNKKMPLYSETSKVLDKYFNNSIVYSQFLDGMIFVNNGIPQYGFLDYKSIRENSVKDLEKHISKRDYFFIGKTISMFNNILKQLSLNAHLSDSQKEKMLSLMLINWADHTFKHMTNEFIECNPLFNELYLKLISYRNFFAHNVLQVKSVTGTRILNEFFDIAKGYVSILDSLKIKKITAPESKEIIEFVAIERMPSRFINYKYEQYLRIDPNTYIGNKLFYSTRGSEYEKIIGLVPVDKKFDLKGTYFEKKKDTFVAKTLKIRNGKKRNLLVSRLNYSKGKDVNLDVNLDDLLFIYASYKGKTLGVESQQLLGYGHCHKLVVLFNEAEENNHRAHASDLEQVISDYYQQRYLPFELAKETHLDIRWMDNKAYFVILDNDNNEIAKIVDMNTLENYKIEVDQKGFFTISETICDYKRRAK